VVVDNYSIVSMFRYIVLNVNLKGSVLCLGEVSYSTPNVSLTIILVGIFRS